MLATVLESISRYGMFTRGDRVGIAVSGGADSVCLLLVMRELAPRWDLALSVVHVEHGIRDRPRATMPLLCGTWLHGWDAGQQQNLCGP